MTAHSGSVTSLAVTPSSNLTSGNRLVVETGVWSGSHATMKSVTDSAGDQFVELLHFLASDGTEMSVWTAPITAGGGTKPTITTTPTAKADVGVAALEYSGLSTVADTTVMDQMADASGTTSTAATVSSGATPATTGAGELALGFYADSGFGDTLTVGSGWTSRANVSKTGDIEFLGEDQTVGSGATPDATAGTGAKTTWLMATVVLKAGSTAPPTVPGAPTAVTATAGNASATVSWTAPSNGGAAITSYTVTPYMGTTAQTATTITGSPPATNATISGLTNGTAYTFTVTATNSVGTGAASTASNSVTPSVPAGGQWGPLLTWPMVAIHSILMDNGNVLQFDGWQQPEPTQVYNPSSQTFTDQTARDSIFCSGMAELPDGRVLVVGGWGGLSTGNQGIVDTSIFDPATSTWTRVADMHYPRWYPDLTELANGNYVAISGNSTTASIWEDTPEEYNPSTNTWTVLSGISTSQVHEEEYPFSYLAPNGDIFTIAPEQDESFYLNAAAQTWTQIGGSSGVVNGSSVMYRPGQILYSGGAPNIDSSSSPAAATTAVINLNSATPQWQQTAPMANPRIYHTLTMLADGTVLAVGGEPTAGQTGESEVSGGILPSEIWNPTTQTWTTVASTGVTRGYHSTALLMPDGTVLVGGSGHANVGSGYPGQYSSQVYSPPYLFKGPRPTISSAAATATYGSNFTISTPNAASISAVNLVSLGSDTHQSDMDQHFVPLTFTAGSGSLTVTAPANGAIAPPGNYMIFIVNSSGVPSVASFINISATPPTLPSAPIGVTATPGNGSATVAWTAPNDGGSPITSYTVTPHIGSAAQTPTTFVGSPPGSTQTVTGLTNGTTYTFTVTATNAVGTSPPSSASNAVTPVASTAPVFVQQVSAHQGSVTSLAVTPSSNVTAGNRLVVETGVWSSGGATMKSVTDSAGDQFVELLHFKASDGAEMSVWTAPITAGGATKPTITATPTAKADVGVAALEYSGLSTVTDATVMDQMADATGTTSGGATVSSSATPATTGANELALGFYADSGFGDNLTAGSGWTSRVNVSNTGDLELLVEDQTVGAGAAPAATAGTGSGGKTVWLMATVVLKNGSQSGGATASPLGAADSTLGAGKVVFDAGSLTTQPVAVSKAKARASERRAAAIDSKARAHFIYEALLKHISAALFCHHGSLWKLGGAHLVPNWPQWWWSKSQVS
jgi:hypothetical protein